MMYKFVASSLSNGPTISGAAALVTIPNAFDTRRLYNPAFPALSTNVSAGFVVAENGSPNAWPTCNHWKNHGPTPETPALSVARVPTKPDVATGLLVICGGPLVR